VKTWEVKIDGIVHLPRADESITRLKCNTIIAPFLLQGEQVRTMVWVGSVIMSLRVSVILSLRVRTMCSLCAEGSVVQPSGPPVPAQGSVLVFFKK
jgi:hypothetical protein